MALEQLPPYRILVVNDCRPQAVELATQLRKAGHTVEIAYGQQSALELEHTFVPEMAIIELGMSGTDAFALARSLRAQTNRTLMLVSMIFSDCEDFDKAEWEACFDDHVNKSHSIPLLMRGRKLLADISPEDWMCDQRLLSEDDLILALLSAVTPRPFRPQYTPDELAPLLPDETLREIRKLVESPNDLAYFLAHRWRPQESGSEQRGEVLRRLDVDDEGDLQEGACRWFRFFNP